MREILQRQIEQISALLTDLQRLVTRYRYLRSVDAARAVSALAGVQLRLEKVRKSAGLGLTIVPDDRPPKELSA